MRNGATGMWDSASTWRFEEELRIGPADEGPTSFSYILGLEVDPAGRIWVLESRPEEIRVFDAHGAFVRTVGRQGSGPGEFAQPAGMAWTGAGLLMVVDQRNARFVFFDTSGARVTERRRPSSGFFSSYWGGVVDRQGAVHDIVPLRGSTRFQTAIVRLDSGFQVADTLHLPVFDAPAFTFERRSGTSFMRSTANVPYAPSLVWWLDREATLWFGITERYRLVRMNAAGDTLRVIERAWTPVQVTEEAKDSAMERLQYFVDQGGSVDRSRIPDVMPPFTQLRVDEDGYVWTRLSQPPGAAAARWDVFDPEGRYLGTVTLPQATQFFVVRRGKLYAVVPDEDGVATVVRYRIRNR